MHYKGHLRDAFCELAVKGKTELMFFDRIEQRGSESMSAGEKLWWLAGQLWQCTDRLPDHVCDELGMPTGSSYAQAARLIRLG